MTTAPRTHSGIATGPDQQWGVRAPDFVTQEPKLMALYESVLNELAIADGIRLLDVECGAGLFLKLAEHRGAIVSGIDVAGQLVDIARQRAPAAELVVGDMEQLPFDDRTFDAVTGFDAFQHAPNPGRALAEAARVLCPGSPLVIATWGLPEQCEAAAYVREVGALLSPPRTGLRGPFALSEPGAIEEFAALGGLMAGPRRDVTCFWEYADETELLRALKSTRLAVTATGMVGEDAVGRAILRAVAPFRMRGGSYRLENVFGYVIARATSSEA
jgi:SAM-dependent methyltransferase